MSFGYAPKNGAYQHSVSNMAVDPGSAEDMPMVCETCLGSNPYVRMVKLPPGHKLCKISGMPFQAYRWKAGAHGRFKETIIGSVVAKERNICQGCLKDLRYDLPVGVRDAMLRQDSLAVSVPTSEVGTAYYYQQRALQQANDADYDPTGQNSLSFAQQAQLAPASRQLDRLSTSLRPPPPPQSSYANTPWRNLPKLCSFWLNGTCSRVLKKACPYRPCCGAFVFPEIAGQYKDIHARLQKQLEEQGAAHVMKHMDADIKDALRKALKTGNRDEAIKKRVLGDDDLSKKYIGRIQTMIQGLEPPEDLTVTTLWIGGVEPDITESELFAMTYAYGRVISVHIAKQSKCAFIEYASRDEAAYAASQLHNNLVVRGQNLQVRWAKPRAPVAISNGSESSSNALLPPPGMESAPVSSYDSSAVETGVKRRRVEAETGLVLPSMDPSRLGAKID